MITNLPAILRGRAIKENVDMDELISKRAVIEAIEKTRANVGHNLERSIGKSIIEILDEVGRDVDRLPSALGTNLAEVGTDCISRQAAIGAIRKLPVLILPGGVLLGDVLENNPTTSIRAARTAIIRYICESSMDMVD